MYLILHKLLLKYFLKQEYILHFLFHENRPYNILTYYRQTIFCITFQFFRTEIRYLVIIVVIIKLSTNELYLVKRKLSLFELNTMNIVFNSNDAFSRLEGNKKRKGIIGRLIIMINKYAILLN